jgi:hypothetical protein
MKLLSITASVLAIASLAACVATPSTTSYGTTSPMLTRVDNILGWDAPGNFGPVPADKAAAGASICASLPGGDFKPTGYHPTARGENGQPLASGGYYCSR